MGQKNFFLKTIPKISFIVSLFKNFVFLFGIFTAERRKVIFSNDYVSRFPTHPLEHGNFNDFQLREKHITYDEYQNQQNDNEEDEEKRFEIVNSQRGLAKVVINFVNFVSVFVV